MNDRPNVADLDRINLRLARSTFTAIDAARLCQPGHVSRNSWIAQAIEEKLARETGEKIAAVQEARIA